MEKRIRAIWALSLSSALLLIAVQGYWLYNQYQHVVKAYSQELAEKILEAGEKEYNLRKGEVKKTYLYAVNRNIELTKDSLGESTSRKTLYISISNIKPGDSPADSLMGETRKYMNSDSPIRSFRGFSSDSLELNKVLDKLDSQNENTYTNKFRYIDDLRSNSLDVDNNEVIRDVISLKFSSKNLSDENMHIGIDRAITNFRNPFRSEVLDSILRADIPEIDYNTMILNREDSIESSLWLLSGNLLSPHVQVFYMYSPFENKGIEINAPIPSQPMFGRMAVQLLLSLVLILLLIGCLMFQIRTILKQHKINEMREGFVNTMVHELKRPVQTLKTFISFLGNKEMRSDESITEQVIQDSMFELDNLSAYLKKLKDMIRADNDVTSLQISRFNLRELIEKIVRLAKSSTTKNINITMLYGTDLLWVEADAVHVANVLNNLIENAIKYSGEHVDIEIKAALKGKELWLTVSDNGIGIPYSEKDKVFAKFYRGSNIPDKNIPGIGLGLSYVKFIIEAHKGKVSLLSDVGKGTSITLSLPQ